MSDKDAWLPRKKKEILDEYNASSIQEAFRKSLRREKFTWLKAFMRAALIAVFLYSIFSLDAALNQHGCRQLVVRGVGQ